ncbi:MAG TPA: hypothetical protein DEE98_00455 [Elusimicrobia bacterium]|nr:MAG: hypothetical protein A2278_03085 [Elusimicrobia bacterium RIFOXYA12_FULL_49_49]OGS15549.1 MAG: hypothetical protein A2251_03335 [Elusimicrobia bacterium RIFOXYA2_FULL_47_53]OGS26895.1 MAG: hypothetical protein A2339_07645 [Elusimicrobia bacterium RIFOXYB12_FULL_50_12]OGS30648.1 MAG: hypothetical protein A2323_07140 [Elusimicrobia bacterium RIFOXYB2_FULL_46_23]HBU68836.1 hypothetical protein [Elusimicrobiota bacterium]
MRDIRPFLKNYGWFIAVFAIALSLRLWHITNPLLDEHSWRQTGSGMVARNYAANMNFFQPTVDFDYRYPMAYGLFEYVVGLLSKVFGFSDLLGRSVSLFTFVFGFIYFYKLVLRYFNESVALWSSFFYAILPVSVFYTRAFQPDGNMVSASIVFLYYFTLWADEGRRSHFLLSVLLANLAFLFKIPSLFMLFPAFGYLIIKNGARALYDWRWYLFFALSVSFPLFFHWYVPIATGGSIQSALFEQDKWGGGPVWLGYEFWWKTFFMNLSEYHFMHAGYVLFIFGLFKKAVRKEQWLFHLWLLGVALFFVAVAKGMHHEYYNLPILPVGSFFMGWFVSEHFGRLRTAGVKSFWQSASGYLVGFMVFYTVVFSMIRLNDRYKINADYLVLADFVKINSQAGDHAVVLSKSEPEVLYYAHRKGVNAHTAEQLERYLSGAGPQYTVLAIAGSGFKAEAPELYKRIANSYNIVYDGKSGIVAKITGKLK